VQVLFGPQVMSNFDRVLFLDVDGVLNTIESRSYDIARFAPSKVKNLVRILEETGCKIVISSAWRIFFGGIGPDSEFQRSLKAAAIELGDPSQFDFIVSRVIGQTLDLDTNRQGEILEFVGEFKVQKFVAVDDLVDNFNIHLPDWLVLTNDETGLDERATEEIIKKLTE